jgi:hypothetical protein
MFTKRTTAALFAIAIASSLIVASGFVGSAFAAKKSPKTDDTYRTLSNGKDKVSGPRPQVDDLGNSGSTPQDNAGSSLQDSSDISSSDLKKLSKCQSDAAEDGDLTLADVNDCYSQVFD